MKETNGGSELIPTGIAGLDEILFGGVSRNNIILVEGAPGTGKTTLALGFIHAGAKMLRHVRGTFHLEGDQHAEFLTTMTYEAGPAALRGIAPGQLARCSSACGASRTRPTISYVISATPLRVSGKGVGGLEP